MLKYSFRVFDHNDNLIITSIVPAECIFDWIEKYKDFGTIKAYIFSDNESEDK